MIENNKQINERATITPPPVHPYNNIADWLDSDFSEPPKNAAWQKKFQQKIDDTFGVKGAIVLAWSGDKRFWVDEFYTNWFQNGQPKLESLEKKPIILWAKIPQGKYDYVYVSPPRWLLLERLHPEQYAPNWKNSCFVTDAAMTSGKKQARPLTPPKEYFVHWRTLGEHEHGTVRGDPPCCARVKQINANACCFGKYRPPYEQDLIAIRKFRDWRNEVNAQRADQPISAKSLQSVSSMTKAYFEEAKRAELRVMREFALSHPEIFIGTAMKDRGLKYSPREVENIIKESCDRREVAELGEKL